MLTYVVFLTMVILYVVLYSRQYGAPGQFEISAIVNTSLPLAFVGIGQTIVVLTKGIDLSVGGLVSLTGAFAAVYMVTQGDIVWVVIATLAIGAGAGLVNGLLVGVGRLQPIIVTIATLSIWNGIALYILAEPGGYIPEPFSSALTGTTLGVIPHGVIVTVIMLILWRVFRSTPLSVSLYAIGNDESGARANGVSVTRTKVIAYVLCGLFSAAGGLYLVAVTTAGDATTGAPYTLTSIAATVLGGVSLLGGRGTAVGTIFGAFILTLLLNVLFFANVSFYLQSFFQGLVLILAVASSTILARLWSARRLKQATGRLAVSQL